MRSSSSSEPTINTFSSLLSIKKPTKSEILSKVYNCIKIPSKLPQCIKCKNLIAHKKQQEINGFVTSIEELHVDVYLCNICQNVKIPLCEECFNCTILESEESSESLENSQNTTPTNCECENREKEKIKYEDYFTKIKQEIINKITEINSNYQKYKNFSQSDIKITLKGDENNNHSNKQLKESIITPSIIFTKILTSFTEIQNNLLKEINNQIEINQNDLTESFCEYEKIIEEMFFSETLEKEENNLNHNENHKLSYSKQLEINNIILVLEKLKKKSEELETKGIERCEQYIKEMNNEYVKLLYTRLMKEIREILNIQEGNESVSELSPKTKNKLKTSTISDEFEINQQLQLSTSSPLSKNILKELEAIIDIQDTQIMKLEKTIEDLEHVVKIDKEIFKKYKFFEINNNNENLINEQKTVVEEVKGNKENTVVNKVINKEENKLKEILNSLNNLDENDKERYIKIYQEDEIKKLKEE